MQLASEGGADLDLDLCLDSCGHNPLIQGRPKPQDGSLFAGGSLADLQKCRAQRLQSLSFSLGFKG